uniref:Uncharacterized protein n=1 Tax=Microplitis mediator bracovirus TaxID=1836595 RepID=A0A2I6SGW9_9VIRU|nr:hypothetical protein MmBV_CPP3 [Microplitis mediator bracovirus]
MIWYHFFCSFSALFILFQCVRWQYRKGLLSIIERCLLIKAACTTI